MDYAAFGVPYVITGTTSTFQLFLGTEQVALLPFSDTRVFVHINKEVIGAVATGNLFIQDGRQHRWEFQTTDGFGYLLASDSFRIALDTGLLAGAERMVVDIKLYYRFVDIPLSEFIGIVQSVQAS